MRPSTLLAALALGAAAGPAMAADIPAIQPLTAPDVVEAAPDNNWSGFYLGALIGYGFGESETEFDTSADVEGVQGGIYAGGNLQYDRFVVGVEGDVLGSGLNGDEAGVSIDQRIEGSLRARAGITLDKFMLYGTAGGAATDLKVEAGGDSESDVLLGWTAGAGVEALLTDKITARVEYRYTDYENQTFTLDDGDVDADLDTNSVRAGVGFKF